MVLKYTFVFKYLCLLIFIVPSVDFSMTLMAISVFIAYQYITFYMLIYSENIWERTKIIVPNLLVLSALLAVVVSR